MRKLIFISLLLIISCGIIFYSGCCAPNDEACYKAWYGLTRHPDPNCVNCWVGPWERFFNPELRQKGDPGAGLWDDLIGVKSPTSLGKAKKDSSVENK
ncbi:MAG: hypothetical protein KAV87_47720 [Desulfobacteraceae bacterium]|nr:hypothetical protein [Desulfobacteraceae bacterium]